MSVTNASGLKYFKTYNNIARYTFLRILIDESAEQKINRKHIILTYEPMRKQNAFYVTHILPILRLEPTENVYTTISFSNTTMYNY